MLKRLWRTLGPNPFDRELKKASKQNKKTFLIAWNRGLGDIPLGLYAIVRRIKSFIPDALITFVTRKDLRDGFAMLEGVEVLVAEDWKRGTPFSLEETMKKLGRDIASFDVVIPKADPTYWVRWQLGKLIPRLQWDPSWDELCKSFGLSETQSYVGVHVQTETNYAYEKNWPVAYWKMLFQRLHEDFGLTIILFGFKSDSTFSSAGLVDLRGKTDLFSMLSVIKNRCKYLVVPDSGVLSMTYYIDASFPVKIVSLWADAGQGVLRQRVASPNPCLVHIPLKAKKEDIRTISVEEVVESLFPKG